MTKSSIMLEQQHSEDCCHDTRTHYDDGDDQEELFLPIVGSPLKKRTKVQFCSKNSKNPEICQCQPSATEAREFRKKWALLTDRERIASLHASYDEFVQTAMDLLPCLGCRSSTEALLQHISSSSTKPDYITASGLRISKVGSLTLDEKYLDNADAALRLFYHQERWGNSSTAKLGRSGKSNIRSRCFLHSQRARTGPRPAAFETLWGKLPEVHRQHLVQIDADQFLTDLESYLRRHRFCCRCKEKVLEAYDLLIGTSCSEDDCEECQGFDYMDKNGDFADELHYTSYLYDELSFCRSSGQIIVPCHMEFMSQLMSRADQEVVGDWGDRHARTIAEAQDEVLTCLGMVIWEKLQNIWTKSKCQKRSEDLVVYLGITCIRRSFDLAVEALHGQEMMEQLLAEEDDESRRLARKKEKRKEKKKKRKNAKSSKSVGSGTQSIQSQCDQEDCQCREGARPNVSDGGESPTKSNESENEENNFTHCKCIDEDAEMQLLSSMGWCGINDDTPEHDNNDEISEDDIMYWKQNQSKLVSRRLEQRQRLQAQFNDLLRKNN